MDRNYILSLKNLYSIFTAYDYPIYSKPPMDLRGYTVLSFWNELLAPCLSNDLRDSLFQKSHNRYTSYVINRSSNVRVYPNLFNAFLYSFSARDLLDMTVLWENFLKRNTNDADTLEKRIQSFLSLCKENDWKLSNSAYSFFISINEPENQDIPIVFRRAYLSACLALHAFCGEQMDHESLAGLYSDAEMSIRHIYSMYNRIEYGRKLPKVITNKKSLVCELRTMGCSFIGREQKLAELQEKLEVYGKVCITGMGGVGKTELAAHWLRSKFPDNRYNRIAYVQGRQTLIDSFIDAFDRIEPCTPEVFFDKCRSILNRSEFGRTLLIIDGYDTWRDTDRLADLECDVIVTTRLPDIDRFATVALDCLQEKQAVELFNACLGQGNTAEEDNLEIVRMLGCHPLSIQLCANICRYEHIAAHDLCIALKKDFLKDVKYYRYGVEYSPEAILTNVLHLADMDATTEKFLRLLSIMPYSVYSLAKMNEFVSGTGLPEGSALNQILHTCSENALLQSNANGFSLHPVVAQLLCRNKVKFSEYAGLFYKQSHLLTAADHSLARCLAEMLLNVEIDEIYALEVMEKCEEVLLKYAALDPLDRLLAVHESALRLYDGKAECRLNYLNMYIQRKYLFDEDICIGDRVEQVLALINDSTVSAMTAEKALAFLIRMANYRPESIDPDHIYGMIKKLSALELTGEADVDRNAALCSFYSNTGDPAAAEYAERLVDFDADDPAIKAEAYGTLAACRLYGGNMEEAAELFAKAYNVYEQNAFCERSIRSAYAYGDFATFWSYTREHEMAIKCSCKCIEILDRIMLKPCMLKLQQLMRLSKSYLEVGDLDEALAASDSVLELLKEMGDPVTVETIGHYNVRAQILFSLGMPERAEMCVKRSAKYLEDRTEISAALRAANMIRCAVSMLRFGREREMPDMISSTVRLLAEAGEPDDFERTNLAMILSEFFETADQYHYEVPEELVRIMRQYE